MTPESGSIIRYPYLWKWQNARGEDTGRKARPVCLAIFAKSHNGHHEMILLPISSQPPREAEKALEIPRLECQRIGIDAPAWITVSEFNYDIFEQSVHLEPMRQAPRKLGARFHAQVIRAFLDAASMRIDRRA